MTCLVSMHQANFFPWLGFFDKILQGDLFVLMDTVQFSKGGRGAWTNRVRILIGGRSAWITMPVKNTHDGFRTIARKEIDDSVPWRERLVATIKTNYSKAPFYKQTMAFLEPLIFFPSSFVGAFNIHAVSNIASLLHCEKKLLLGSSLDIRGTATELLISVTKAVGGDAYLCGNGAAGYQKDHLFAEAGLELLYQNFVHPSYPQYGTDSFVGGLSIIDAMMNVGPDGLSGLLCRERASIISNGSVGYEEESEACW